MMTSMLDPRLYLIVDSSVADDCITQAVDGGVTLVQLRDKTGTTRQRIYRAQQLISLLAPSGVPLFINDRVDIAMASGAQGVHLGQEDMSVEDARRVLPASTQLGLTVRNADEAKAAPVDLLDYISVGGVFPTQSKNNTTPPLGTEGLASLVRRLRAQGATCLTAIAGIDRDNVTDVMSCGVDGVAVISAITEAPSPQDAARLMRSSIDSVIATQSPTQC